MKHGAARTQHAVPESSVRNWMHGRIKLITDIERRCDVCGWAQAFPGGKSPRAPVWRVWRGGRQKVAPPFPPRGTSGTALPQVGDWVHGLCAAGDNESALQIQSMETAPMASAMPCLSGVARGCSNAARVFPRRPRRVTARRCHRPRLRPPSPPSSRGVGTSRGARTELDKAGEARAALLAYAGGMSRAWARHSPGTDRYRPAALPAVSGGRIRLSL